MWGARTLVTVAFIVVGGTAVVNGDVVQVVLSAVASTPEYRGCPNRELVVGVDRGAERLGNYTAHLAHGDLAGTFRTTTQTMTL